MGFDNAHPVQTQSGPGGRQRPERDHRHRLKNVWPSDYKDAATLLEDFWTNVVAMLKEKGVQP